MFDNIIDILPDILLWNCCLCFCEARHCYTDAGSDYKSV